MSNIYVYFTGKDVNVLKSKKIHSFIHSFVHVDTATFSVK